MSRQTGRRPAVLGLDLGTTEVKAGLVGLDGSLLALARGGYGLDVSGGHGWAEQDPGAWWSAVVRAVRALRAPTSAPTSSRSASTDTARRSPRSTHAARRRDPRSRSSTHAPQPRPTSSPRRPGSADGRSAAAGRALGRAPRACGRGRDPLVPHDLGVARIPPDRGGGRARWSRPGRPGRGAVAAATGVPVDRRPPPGAIGQVVGGCGRCRRCARSACRRSRSPVAPNDAFASYLGAGLLEPGDAYDPGGSAGGFGVYWDRPVEVPGAFVTPAPLAGLYSVGAAMAATGRALDWFRDDIVGGDDHDRARSSRRPRPRRPAPTAWSSCRTSPASDRRSGIPTATRRVRRPDPRARPGPPRPGDRRGERARHPPRRRRRCSRPGSTVTAMRACGGPARSDVWNQVKADVTGLPGRSSRPSSRPRSSVRRSSGRSAIGAHADVPSAIRAMTRIERAARAARRARADLRPRCSPPTSASTRRSPRSCGRSASAPDGTGRSGPAAIDRVDGVDLAFPTRDGGRLPVLDGVDLDDPGRRHRRAHRPQRLRQVHAPARHRRAARARTGEPSRSTATAIAGPDPRIGLVFQEPRLLPWRSAADNITYPLELAGWPRRAARRSPGRADGARRASTRRSRRPPVRAVGRHAPARRARPGARARARGAAARRAVQRARCADAASGSTSSCSASGSALPRPSSS